VYSQLVLAATFFLIKYSNNHCLLHAVGLVLPPTLAVLFLVKEVGLISTKSLLRLAVLAGIAAVIILLCLYEPRLIILSATPLIEKTIHDVHIVLTWGILSWLVAIVLILFVPSGEATSLKLSFLGAIILTGLQPTLKDWFVAAHYSNLADSVAVGGSSIFMIVGLVQLSYSMAYKDPLTGLPARRALDEAMERLSSNYVMAMLDVDHFKRFNDRFGHEVGDQVLKMVASRMARVGKGKAYRYGGEEFTLVFQGCNMDTAREYLERLRIDIQESKLTIRSKKRPKKKPDKPTRQKGNAKQVSVTVSIGFADFKGRRKMPEMVLKAADKALYQAKKKGRNKVVPAK